MFAEVDIILDMAKFKAIVPESVLYYLPPGTMILFDHITVSTSSFICRATERPWQSHLQSGMTLSSIWKICHLRYTIIHTRTHAHTHTHHMCACACVCVSYECYYIPHMQIT